MKHNSPFIVTVAEDEVSEVSLKVMYFGDETD